MIKLFFPLLISTIAWTTSAESCHKENNTCYKGRLEIKAICYNYTIKVLEGNIDTSLVVANWTDDQTGKKYTNVFGLASPCTFPSDIKEGDEFLFTIDNSPEQNCNICMAYYPTPPKKIRIAICKN